MLGAGSNIPLSNASSDVSMDLPRRTVLTHLTSKKQSGRIAFVRRAAGASYKEAAGMIALRRKAPA